MSAVPVGAGAAPLVNQRGVTVPPADAARLSYVLFHHGHATDKVTVAAVATLVHAVMRDLPGLTPESLAAGAYPVQTDAAAVKARAAEMWSASGERAAPYRMTIDIPGGPHQVGRPVRGTVRLVGRGGAGIAGVPVTATLAAAADGTELRVDGPTGPDGSVGFTVTPKAPRTQFSMTVGADLPGEQVTVYHTGRGRQRLVGTGSVVRPRADGTLDAQPLGSAQLVKVSSDPAVATIGEGFRFEVRDGANKVVAERSTDQHGAIAPITDLPAGKYKVTETAHPAGFVPDGPWTFDLAAGQRATWTVRNAPVRIPVRLHKTSTDAARPVPQGVTFTLRRLDGPAPGPVGTFRTGERGLTPDVRLAPGRYRVVEVGAPPGFKVAPPTEFLVEPPKGRQAGEAKVAASTPAAGSSSSSSSTSVPVKSSAPASTSGSSTTSAPVTAVDPSRAGERVVQATPVLGDGGVAVVQIPNTPLPDAPVTSTPTTVPPSVPLVTKATPSTAAKPSPTVPTAARRPAQQLPETGSAAARLAMVGACLVTVGGAGLGLARWRRRRSRR